MITLLILIILTIISQIIYIIKPFLKEEYKELYDKDCPYVYYSNKYLGISFHNIFDEYRLFGWQSGKYGFDKCIFICNISIVFIFLMEKIK